MQDDFKSELKKILSAKFINSEECKKYVVARGINEVRKMKKWHTDKSRC